MIACAVTDLPDPDSPRMASVSPSSQVKLTPLTALATPSRVRNSTCRSSTSSSRPSARRSDAVRRLGLSVSVVVMCGLLSAVFGSKASRTASPSMMNASTVTAQEHGREQQHVRRRPHDADEASEIATPQETTGGCRPMPRKDSVASTEMKMPSAIVAHDDHRRQGVGQHVPRQDARRCSRRGPGRPGRSRPA